MATNGEDTEGYFHTNQFPFMYTPPLSISPNDLKRGVETKTFIARNGRVDSYIEYTSRNPIVVRGGFSPRDVTAEDRSAQMRAFPPLPIAAYRTESSENNRTLDPSTVNAKLQEHDADFNLEKPLAIPREKSGNHPASSWCFGRQDSDVLGGASTTSDQGREDSESTEDESKQENAGLSQIDPTKAEILADKINFDREASVEQIPGASDVFLSGEEQREEFIAQIGEGAYYELCSECKQTHIPPGAPITLQDRDTCLSYVPEWFPKKLDLGWDTFTQMLNELVKLDEMSQGYGHKNNPDRKVWDLEYHEPDEMWKKIGRRGGWWKCKAGEDTSEAEKKCRICHRTKTPKEIEAEEILLAKPRKSVAERKQDILDFMQKRMQKVAAIDKAVVLGNIRAGGWPPHLGPFAHETRLHILPPMQKLEVAPAKFFPTVTSTGRLKDTGSPTSTRFRGRGRGRSKVFEF